MKHKAILWTGDNWPEVFRFIHKKPSDMERHAVAPDGTIELETSEDVMIVDKGDLIVKSSEGRLSLLKDIQISKGMETVTDADHLVSFLYELMRDHVPIGIIEGVVKTSLHKGETEFCNGWLAQYAQDVAKRLRG